MYLRYYIATDFSHLDDIIDVKPEFKNVVMESNGTDLFALYVNFFIFM